MNNNNPFGKCICPKDFRRMTSSSFRNKLRYFENSLCSILILILEIEVQSPSIIFVAIVIMLNKSTASQIPSLKRHIKSLRVLSAQNWFQIPRNFEVLGLKITKITKRKNHCKFHPHLYNLPRTFGGLQLCEPKVMTQRSKLYHFIYPHLQECVKLF